jgi:predicted metal-dependent hydrolase
MNSFPRSKKEWLKEQLEKTESSENIHIQILEIIKKYTDQFTTTQNGILISSDNLSDDCLNDIEKYLIFCNDQKKRIEDDFKTRKSYERLISE